MADSASSIYFWTAAMGWWWISPDIYPRSLQLFALQLASVRTGHIPTREFFLIIRARVGNRS